MFNDQNIIISKEKSEERLIKFKKVKSLHIDFDTMNDLEIIKIKRGEKTLTFPIWEFWQVLEKYETH